MTNKEEAIKYLDEKFPKGDKRRGEAMCLLAIALMGQEINMENKK